MTLRILRPAACLGRRPAALPLLCLALVVPGCGGDLLGSIGRERTLTVATTWPREECLRLEAEFRAWLGPVSDPGKPSLDRVTWIELARLPAPGRPVETLPRADVLLGGLISDFARLSRSGTFLPLDDARAPSFLEIRRQPLDFSEPLERPGVTVALDDPRIAPATRAWCLDRLRNGPWPERYADMIRLAGHCPSPIGWREGSARAALERHEVAAAILPVSGSSPAESRSGRAFPVVMRGGAAILPAPASEPLARAFLRFLSERHGAAPPAERDIPDPDVDDLVADLLGAVVVDAREELLDAWEALGGVDAAPASPALTWMTEPPPWPPASVEKLLVRGGDRGLMLSHDLAGQLAPDPEVRFWLIQSWLRPSRPVDLALLSELADAAGGRLVREPRFRAWLAGEWTAWARQRYRRVARRAHGAVATESPAAGTNP